MTTRDDVLEALSRIAFGHAYLDEEPMRARAFDNAHRTLKKLPALRAAFDAGEVARLAGIGPGILDVVGRVFRGEPVAALERLEELIPAGLFELRRLPGIGPKKLRLLHEELGVASLGELEYAVNENRLLSLSGFGPKTQDKIREALSSLRERASHRRLDQAHDAIDAVIARLRALPGVARAERAGEARRGVEVVGDLLVAALIDADAVPAVASALGASRGERAGVPVLVLGGDVPVTVGLGHFADAFGAVWLWLTGAPEHVQALAARAGERGGTFGPLGLHLGERRVPCPEEADVYAALDLHPTPPERREPGVPLVPRGAAAPRLLRREDLRGALHNHTTASDGISSLEEMRAAAHAAGLEYLGISEHSQTAAYAGGLDAGALLGQVAAIAALNARAGAGGTTVLSGVESDILRDGELDYPDDVLAALDVVVASVHNRYGLGRDAMSARMLAAAGNPWADIIGHPTGRLLLGRPGADFDVEAWLDACALSGVAVELNANPQRLDLCDRHLAMAKERGLLVSISADAHSAQALQHLDFGVLIARRAGLGPADVLNAKPLDELRAWLAARRVRARLRATV